MLNSISHVLFTEATSCICKFTVNTSMLTKGDAEWTAIIQMLFPAAALGHGCYCCYLPQHCPSQVLLMVVSAATLLQPDITPAVVSCSSTKSKALLLLLTATPLPTEVLLFFFSKQYIVSQMSVAGCLLLLLLFFTVTLRHQGSTVFF